MEGQTPPTGSRPSFPGADIASAGILLAAAPAVGYLVTWVNLLGYANQFDIPGGLIAPQLANVLATTIGVGVGILFIFSLIIMSRPTFFVGRVDQLDQSRVESAYLSSPCYLFLSSPGLGGRRVASW